MINTKYNQQSSHLSGSSREVGNQRRPVAEAGNSTGTSSNNNNKAHVNAEHQKCRLLASDAAFQVTKCRLPQAGVPYE